MASILIVDDSKSIRMNMKKIFEQNGYDVVAEASTGMEAYKKYKKYRPDLVIMDIIMPDINGVTAVEKIISDFSEANIIIVSSVSQKSMIVDALKKGAKNYLIKPVKEEKLLDEVDEILQGEVTKKKYEDTSPLDFKVRKDTFVLRIRDNFKDSDFKDLQDAVDKMLEVDSVKILFDIGELNRLDDKKRDPFFDIITKMYGKNAKLQIFTKDDNLIEKLKDREMGSIIYE
ncbi:MAG: response regulator [Fusobacteriota bacterium]